MGLSANSHSASRRSPLPARAFLSLSLGTAILPAAPAVAQFTPSSAKPSAYALRARSFLSGRAVLSPIAVAQSMVAAREQHMEVLTRKSLLPRIRGLNALWQPLGPNQVASLAYGNVTGRVTAIAIDPADTSGNTVYLGTTGGGVWKSSNAAGPSASVSFTPLTDTLPVFSANAGTAVIPSLSIGAVSVQAGVVLAGTGDPNDATDSFYGSGILRSVDGGLTWTIIQQSQDGAAGNHSFTGLGFAGFAWSSTSPDTVVAAVSQAAEGTVVNAVDATNSVMGLYYSTNAGASWQMATIMDGGQFVQRPLPGDSGGNNAATSVVWNPIRQRFYAAVRYLGFYESPDGATWTRLANQPGASLSLTACPSNAGGTGSTACPIFRGALAVQPVTGDTFALTVDGNNIDQGLWQDVCGLTGVSCTNNTVAFAKQLPSAPLETGNGNAVIPQADYNLALAAMPYGADTLLFAGTVDLYRCSLTGGCILRNTTNAIDGCAGASPAQNAMVAPAQHAIATLANSTLLYLGNDGGLWRSTDAVNQQATPCSPDDATHFQNLNSGLGSLAEITSFAQHPSDPATLLVGLGANGTAATSTASTSPQSPPWAQLATGEGGTVAIDQTNPELWYLSNGAGVSIHQCTNGASCTSADFNGIPTIGPTQTAQDASLIDAPWLLDPALPANILIGTCRVWRGPAGSGAAWASANAISKLLSGPQNPACNASDPVLRSLAAAGLVSSAPAAQNAGSKVLYAGMAGRLDGGGASGGHLFSTSSADTADGTTAWTDLTSSPVTNDLTPFNPGGFDISSLAADSHDPTGKTLYATVMGFAGNGTNAPHLYRSIDGGASWTNISNNLPNAPANSVIVDPNDANTIYVALDTGVYATTQVAACANPLNNCWSIYGTSLPNSPVIQLAAAPAMPTGDGRTGELRAATYGRGLWQIPLLTALNPADPAIALSPASLTFTDQAVATASSPQTITVTNSGNAPLVITQISTTGDFATDTPNDTCTAAPIATGQTCTVQVRFLPTAIGSRSGFLIVYGNVPGGQATATLGGTGTPPATVILNPIDISFSATNINATSLAQNITISNTGGTTTTLQTPSVSGADFTISANTCTSTLKADTGCTIAITFTPTASGAHIGSFSITDDAGTQTASLSGIGMSPATDALSSSTLTFATQQLTTVSAPQQIALTNSGDVALTLISAQIPGSDFTVTNACGNSLNPHSTCAIDVAFQPQSIGAVTAQLTIADQYRTQTVTLSGTGIAPPGVSLSPLYNLAFPTTGVGQTSAPQTVTLTNNGGLPLSLSSTTLSGDFSILPGSDTCGTTLPVANACTLQLVFAPTAGGARTGVLTITDSAPLSPQVLHLTGNAVDFALTPDGDTTVTIASGQNAVFPLLFTSATALLTTFTCGGMPLNAICNITPSTIAVSGATTVSVTVLTGTLTASLVPPGQNMVLWLATLLPLGLLTLRRGRLPRLACALLLCALIVSPTGCGAGRQLPSSGSTGTSPGQTPSTPAGTYPITVSATSNGLTHTISLTLIVR